jgi:hypothetical protein
MRKTVRFMTILVILLFGFILLTPGTASASTGESAGDIDGMILKSEDSGDIFINRGREHLVEEGTVFYVTRIGKPVGRIIVVSVDKYSSLCHSEELISGYQFSKGDAISTRSYTPPEPAVNNERSRPQTREVISEEKSPAEYESDINKRFKEATKKHTRSFHFKQNRHAGVSHPLYSPLTTYTPLLVRVPLVSSTMDKIALGLSAAYTLNYMKNVKQSNPYPNVHVEVTYWSPEYLDAYAAYQAHRESISDQNFINAAKENVYRQKGMDRYYVFQVRVINPGPGYCQFMPFSNHFYMKIGSERTILPENYDQTLDASLAPNQISNGYVYFRKFDTNGQPLLLDNSITVELHNILGHSKRVNFK